MSSPIADKKTKTIVVKTSDDQTIEIEEAIAVQFDTLKVMINAADGEFAASVIPLPNVTAKILAKVILYCQHRAAAAAAAAVVDGGKSSDDSFYSVLTEELEGDQETLFDLIKAANYLDIKSLLDFTCKIVADMMGGKSPEEIRRIFHIKNDYTKEEEEKVRRDNAWAFKFWTFSSVYDSVFYIHTLFLF